MAAASVRTERARASVRKPGDKSRTLGTTNEERETPFPLEAGRVDPTHERVPGEFNLERELRQSTLMCTRKRYKSQASNFLLYLYRRQDEVLNPPFAEAMKAKLEGPRKRHTTDASLVGTLLPGYCEGEAIEPLKWEKVTLEVILAPMANSWEVGATESMLASYRSALNLLFKDFNKIAEWRALGPNMSTIMTGWKKRIARNKKETGGNIEKGVTALPFKLYAHLSKHLAMKDKTGPFSWCYSTLLWNLMCRSDSISYVNLNHIKVKDDHLIIYFAQSKTDQEGRLAKHPKAIFGNPLNPWVCPLTALGAFLVCITSRTEVGNSTCPLFQGSQSETATRFRKLLHSLLRTIELEEFGLSSECIGTHSYRKGAATYCSSGGTACPSSSAISVRAGWSQPGVEDTYRRYDSAGDEHVGRVVAGLPMHSEELALIAPTFIPSTEEEEKFIQDCLHQCMDSSQINVGVARRCLASLVYHLDTLREDLPANHKLWADPLMKDRMLCTRLKSLIFCGYEGEDLATKNDLRATGVPPHCSMLRQLKQVEREVGKLAPNLENHMSMLPQIIQSALDEAVEAGKIEGAPITTANLERTITRVIGTELGDLHRILGQRQELVPPRQQEAQERSLSDYGLLPFRKLSEKFEVPSMTLRQAWQHWSRGDTTSSGRPWRLIQPSEIGEKKARERLKRYRKLMLAVQEKVPRDAWKEDGTFEEYEAMFEAVKGQFQFNSNTTLKRRHGELSWETILSLKYKKQRSP